MRPVILARVIAAFMLALPLAACRREPTDPAPAVTLTNEPFFITGTITGAIAESFPPQVGARLIVLR
jgi:hypothetical protein